MNMVGTAQPESFLESSQRRGRNQPKTSETLTGPSDFVTIDALMSDPLFEKLEALLTGGTLGGRRIQLRKQLSIESIFELGEGFVGSCLILELPREHTPAILIPPRLSVDRAVIAVAEDPSASLIVRSLKQGAIDFVPAPFAPRTLNNSLLSALQHASRLLVRKERSAALKRRFWSLTPREREVMPLLTHGLLNKQAASVLGISLVTLQIHRGNIMRKMHASSFADLVRSSMMLEKLLHLQKPAECN